MKKLMFKMKKAAFAASLVCVSANVFGMENQRWFRAAESGDLKTIDRMIREGIYLNVKDRDGNTALMLAAKESRLEIVKRLVKGNDEKVSALDVVLDFVNAWKTGHPWNNRNLIRWANQLGLDLLAQNNDGNTALMLAVESARSYDRNQAEEQYRIVVQLQAASYDLFRPFISESGKGLFDFKRLEDFKRYNRKCQRRQVKLENLKNNRNETALQIALENAVRFPDTMLPLHIAHECLLNASHGDLGTKNSRGETLLMLEIDRDYFRWKCGSWRCAWLGISGWKGFDINEKDEDGVTVLMRAAAGDGMIDALEMILDDLLLVHVQVDVNAKNRWGNTAFHIAVKTGSPEKVMMFINHGADINVTGENGLTPMEIAWRRGNIDIITALQVAGAR